MLLGLLGLLGAVALVNWIVNPYGAWRTTVVDPAYRPPGPVQNEAGERVSTAYRIRAERPSTLLVGSSRMVVGMYIEQGGRDVHSWSAQQSARVTPRPSETARGEEAEADDLRKSSMQADAGPACRCERACLQTSIRSAA